MSELGEPKKPFSETFIAATAMDAAYLAASGDAAPQPAPVVGEVSSAASDVLAERRRQIEAEGWTAEHDDQHIAWELARAAAVYCMAAALDSADRAVMDEFGASGTPARFRALWPWDSEWWKPKSRRRDLVKAGALIIAEIERLDRAALAGEGK